MVSTQVINLRVLKPLDDTFLTPYLEACQSAYVLEDGSEIGGLHAIYYRRYKSNASRAKIHSIAIRPLY